MATPPRIDIGPLLLPIPVGASSEPGLERENVHMQFRQTLRSGDANQPVPGRDNSRIAELGPLIDLGKAYLERKSKDLVVAAWMAEALTQSAGFAGVRDGIRLMHGLISECWDICYPQLGPDGDTDLRSRPFEALASDRYMLLYLRRCTLTDGDSGAVALCYLDIGQGPPGNRPEPTEADFASGPIFEAISRSSRSFYERLADDVREAREADQALGAEVRKRFKADAPDLTKIGRVLMDAKRLVDVILTVKRRQAPDGETGGAPVADSAPGAPPRLTSAALGPTNGAADYGRILIDFSDRARILADAAAKLKENREKYASLKDEMEKLDAEYAEITDRIARDENYEPLLARRVARSSGAEPSQAGPAANSNPVLD